MDHRRRVDIARARHSLSYAEYCLLSTAGYRINLPPEEFVSETWKLNEGGAEPLPSIEQLQAALTGLRARGLLTVLSEDDVRRESERISASTVPELVEPDYRAGDVDFTSDGHRIFREVVLEAFGADHVQYSDSGFVFDEASRSFIVLAATRALCMRRIAEIQDSPESFTGDPSLVLVVEVTLPERIGAWKPTRFWLVEEGFRSVVRVAPGE